MVFGLTSIFILISSLITILFSKKILKTITGTLEFPVISSFFMFWYFIRIFIGSTALCIYPFSYEVLLKMYDTPENFLLIWFLAMAGVYLLLLGMYLANKVFRINSKEFIAQYSSINKFEKSDYFLLPILGFALCFCIGIFALYLNQLKEIPIIAVFKGKSVLELAVIRSASGNSFSGKYWLYQLFFKDIPLLIVVIAFFKRNKNIIWKSFFYFTLSYTIFAAIFDLQKVPFINLIMILLAAHIFYQKKINWKIISWTLIIGFSALSGMYFFYMGVNDIGPIFESIFHRALIGQVNPIFWYIEYTKSFGLLFGKSFPNPHQLFPFIYIDLSKEVMSFAHPELYSLNIVGTMPTVFYTEYLANFGIIAALLSMLTVGFIIRVIDILSMQLIIQTQSLFWLTLYVYYMSYLSNFVATFITKLIIDERIIIPTLIFTLLYLLQNDFITYNNLLSNSKNKGHP